MKKQQRSRWFQGFFHLLWFIFMVRSKQSHEVTFTIFYFPSAVFSLRENGADENFRGSMQRGGRGLGLATRLHVILREEASVSTKNALTPSITMATYHIDDVPFQHGQIIGSRGLKVV